MNFEKRYMERSWQEKREKSYKSQDIDDAIKEFYRFLKKEKAKGKMLDIGCGNGRNAFFFANNGFEVEGIDFAESAIKECRKHKSAAKFKAGDILELRLKDKEYDVMLDAGCLHHIRKRYWNKYIKNLIKGLKEGGYYYLHGISDCDANKRLPKHQRAGIGQ